jgi:HD superfamily phosphohydrolase
MVYPGATHTRFAHSVGVFHTARRLLEIIKRKTDRYDSSKARTALCAALLHDLGHGPFSHTFETVEKQRGLRKKHEEWSADLVRGDTEVRALLAHEEEGLPDAVARLLTQREPEDIYAAIVSSQFDADRLDYLRRDRYMSGTGGGGIDFDWLLDCLEVGRITIRVGDEQDFVDVDGLYLNHKGLRAAEEYLLARYHLYGQVYMHKTTRGAEQMLGALLGRVASMVKGGDIAATGLADGQDPTVAAYLNLDDAVVTAAVEQMQHAEDALIADLAKRLVNRELYKCLDVGALAKGVGGDSSARFRRRLTEVAEELELESGTTLLTDQATISPYGVFSFDEPGALQMVLIGDQKNPPMPEDIANRSKIVAAIPDERIYRVYAPTADKVERLHEVWREVAR